MKKLTAAIMIGLMATALVACGQPAKETTETQAPVEATVPAEESVPAETEPAEEAPVETAAPETESPETESAPAESEPAAEVPAVETAPAAEGEYADNFAVDAEAAAAFAGQIQTAVADGDLEALAALCSFPMYIDLEGNNTLNSADELIALGAETVLTEELTDAVAAADASALTASRAGFVLSADGTANIIFGVVNGALAITGINY